jgi:Pyruvate/2-oxoacid:ferredoxin oxidoreductase gamma subunit
VRIAESEVLSPAAAQPHVLVAFNAPSLDRFAPAVPAGGVVLYDSSVVTELPELDRRARMIGVPFTRIAAELGNTMVKNIAALGALQEATQLFPRQTFLTAIGQMLREKPAMIPLDEEAFRRGGLAAREDVATPS